MSEETGTLAAVVAHWLPRMQTAGLTPGDLKRVIDEAGDWSNWCRTFSSEAERHLADGEAAEAAARSVTAGEAFARAALFYHFAQFMFFDDLDQKATADVDKVAAYARAAPHLLPPAHPVSVPYGGDALYGYLRLPRSRPAPLVVLVPGSDSTKEEFASLEDYFLRREMATFSLDGPGQGEGRAFGTLTPDWAPVFEALTAILPDLDGIDASRVGAMGMAFGGHLVLQGAHALPDLKAAICMNGFFDLGAFWDDLPDVYRRNMRYALGGEAPGDTAERARAFTLAETPPPNAPLLVIHGGKDRIFPVGEAERFRCYGAKSEVVIYEDGNHVCNNIAYRYRALMADWMAERLTG